MPQSSIGIGNTTLFEDPEAKRAKEQVNLQQSLSDFKRWKNQKQAEHDAEKSAAALQPIISDMTISPTEAAAIQAEVREVMREKFAADRATPGTTPVLHKVHPESSFAQVHSDTAASLATVIDLCTH